MLELSVLSLEQMDLVPGGVSHAIAGKQPVGLLEIAVSDRLIRYP